LHPEEDPLVDQLARHVQPLFEMWMADGQLHSDLDIHDTVEWMYATSTFLLTPSWRQRPTAAKRRFIDRYFLRALLRPRAQG
jgi:TetR/AcrR family transcriptional regulator